MYKNLQLDTKFKLAALWLTIFLLFVYGDILSMWIPDRLNNLLNGSLGHGKTSPSKLLNISFFITIYACMPLVNMFLKAKVSRIVNIVVAILLIGVWTLILTQFSFGPMWKFYIYLAIVEVLLAIVVIIIAFKWPKEPVV